MSAHYVIAVDPYKIYGLYLYLIEVHEEMNSIPLFPVGDHGLNEIISGSERKTDHRSLSESKRIGDLVDRAVSAAGNDSYLVTVLFAQFDRKVSRMSQILRIAQLDLGAKLGIVRVYIVDSIIEHRQGLGICLTADYQDISHISILGFTRKLIHKIDHIGNSLDVIKKIIGKPDVIRFFNIDNKLVELK